MIAGIRTDIRLDFRCLIAALFVLTLVGFALLHRLYGVRNPEHGDQAAYLELAYNIHAGRGFTSRGLSPFMPRPEIEHPESVRAPLYPLLLSVLADDSPRFFFRAKLVTLAISLLLPLMAFLMLTRTDGNYLAAIFILLLVHNRPFQTYATEVWCENLLLLFCIPALLLLRNLLRENAGAAVGSGLVAGLLLALGYLTKVSATLIVLCWVITIGWLLLRRKSRISSPPLKGGVAVVCTFLAVIVPYLLWNRLTVGRFFREVDLRGAFWLDQGREYWIPHENVPGLTSYLETHTPWDILNRLGHGIWDQGSNLVEASAAPFAAGEAVGLLVLGAGLVGLAVERSPHWRGFQLLFLALTLLLAGWYATIDVAPRFIYLLVPLVVYNATQGLIFLASRIAGGKAGNSIPFPLEAKKWALAIAALLLLPTIGKAFQPLEGRGYQISPAELETMRAIRQHLEADQVLCMGPSHRLPYPWLIDRKTVFLPDYSEWRQITPYFDQYRVHALLLDQEIFLRRIRLLEGYFAWEPERGLWIRQKLPGMKPVFRNQGPIGEFFLLLREP